MSVGLRNFLWKSAHFLGKPTFGTTVHWRTAHAKSCPKPAVPIRCRIKSKSGNKILLVCEKVKPKTDKPSTTSIQPKSVDKLKVIKTESPKIVEKPQKPSSNHTFECPEKKDGCNAKKPEPCGAKKAEPCGAKKPEPCSAKKSKPCGAKKQEPCDAKKPEPCGDDKNVVKVDECKCKKLKFVCPLPKKKTDDCEEKKLKPQKCADGKDEKIKEFVPAATEDIQPAIRNKSEKKSECGQKKSSKSACSMEKKSCPKKKEPCAKKKEPCAQKKEPCAKKKEPCSQKEKPCAKKKKKCPKKEEPKCPKPTCKKKKLPTCKTKKKDKKGRNPCAQMRKKKDICPKKESCEQKKTSKLKEPPKKKCKTKLVPSCPSESKDPCKTKTEPKNEETPCEKATKTCGICPKIKVVPCKSETKSKLEEPPKPIKSEPAIEPQSIKKAAPSGEQKPKAPIPSAPKPVAPAPSGGGFIQTLCRIFCPGKSEDIKKRHENSYPGKCADTCRKKEKSNEDDCELEAPSCPKLDKPCKEKSPCEEAAEKQGNKIQKFPYKCLPKDDGKYK